MKRFCKRLLFFVLLFGLLTALSVSAQTQEASPDAKEISGIDLITDHAGFQGLRYLFDGDVWEGMKTEETAHLTPEYEEGIGFLPDLSEGLRRIHNHQQ